MCNLQKFTNVTSILQKIYDQDIVKQLLYKKLVINKWIIFDKLFVAKAYLQGIMFQVLIMLNLIHKHGQNKTWLTVGLGNSKIISMSALKDWVSHKYFHLAPILAVFLQ